MAIKGFFYNSVSGDRKYNGVDINEDKMPFYKEGVCYGQLQVTADGGSMTIKVDGGPKTGYAFLNSHTIHNTTVLELTVSQASGTLNRIDRVVLRNNETERKPSIFILEGAFSSAPVAPELTNNEVIQDKCLAEIYVSAGAVEITQNNITDTRADKTLCGFVGSQFEELDFSQWTAQFDAWFKAEKQNFSNDYAEFIEEYANLTQSFMDTQEVAWNTWFTEKQTELSGDVAGKLQLLIDGLTTQVHFMACKININYALEDVSGEITVTLTNNTTGSTYTAKMSQTTEAAFYICEAGNYTVTVDNENAAVTPKLFTISNTELMTVKTLVLRDGNKFGFIGGYVGAYINN